MTTTQILDARYLDSLSPDSDAAVAAYVALRRRYRRTACVYAESLAARLLARRRA
jgi:hypothetical protein